MNGDRCALPGMSAGEARPIEPRHFLRITRPAKLVTLSLKILSSLAPPANTWPLTPPGVLAMIDDIGPDVEAPLPKKSNPAGRLRLGVRVAVRRAMFVQDAMIGPVAHSSR